MPRYSIEVAAEEESSEKQYVVEVYYQKLGFYILPKTSGHIILRSPSAVYITRKATVGDYHRKIAEILVIN